MLNLESPRPGLLFASILYRTDLYSEENLKKIWCNDYGESFSFIPSSNPLAAYYSKEMGDVSLLSRFFLVTKKTYDRDYLLKAKLWAQAIEGTFADNNNRRVNIDIGLLSLENFILATSKNYSHRIYIGENIFADLTYEFQKGQFKMLPWTYPDYQDEQKIKFLTQMRIHLLNTLNN